ncbi:MAG: hypothetical protein NVSMB31_02680 [Vulcanimicrobiaceae bacterium]
MRYTGSVFLFALAALLVSPLSALAEPQPAASVAPAPKGEEASSKPAATPAPSPSPSETAVPPCGYMPWREVGPSLPGGRVTSVAGSATNPNLYYIGAAGGGVWKSTDGAESWNAVFEKQAVSAIGAVAIDPKNNEIVWVGTGESNPRNDVSYGDGVYKTTDGGKTWANVGLPNSRHISRILIDPNNTNHVLVGVLGDVYGDSEDRGVYLTEDGGKTWTKSLYVSAAAGASDMAMDAQHPNVVYAGI